MYGFGGVGLSEVQISISELSVVGGSGWVGGLDKRTSWSDLVGVRQKENIALILIPLFSQAIDLEVPLHIPGLASTDSYYNLR